jgi:DNA-binding transcriptional LysR family regulator
MPIRRNVDIDLLRTFVTIVHTGSFTRTAAGMNRTQSAISLQIKRLEESLGLALFRRGGRRVTLAADGEMLFDYAQRVLAANDDLIARLAEPALAGAVRIGAPETFTTTRLPATLGRFQSAYPQIALEVQFGPGSALRTAFDGGTHDLLIEKRLADGTNWPGTSVWREPLAWFARDVPASDAVVPLIVAPNGSLGRNAAICALDDAGRKWRISYSVGDSAGALAAAAAGLGVAVLPRDTCVGAGNGSLRVMTVHASLPELPEIELRLQLTDEPTARAQRLFDFLVASYAAAADY